MDTYSKAVEYLESLINYEKAQRRFRFETTERDLERFTSLLGKVGNPERNLRIIHVAGTKGKGTVATYIAEMLAAGRYSCGLYTSPHIHSYRERIKVDGKEIAAEEFGSIIERLREIKEKEGDAVRSFRTVFEMLTACALVYFYERNVDFAVIETGLGGRLDATNVVTPILTVITSIGFDHTFVLGSTIEEITGEKAGILKPGIEVVLEEQEHEFSTKVESVIKAQCEQQGARLIRMTDEGEITNRKYIDRPDRGRDKGSALQQEVGVVFKDGTAYQLRTRMQGAHSARNLTTAVCAIRSLREKGFHISDRAIAEGAAAAMIEGRIEIVHRAPDIVVDSAHCALSARALRCTLDEIFPKQRRFYFLGMLVDKDIQGVLRELSKDAELARLCAIPTPTPRGMQPKELLEVMRDYDSDAFMCESVRAAVEWSENHCTIHDVVVFCGSMYTVAPVKCAIDEALH